MTDAGTRHAVISKTRNIFTKKDKIISNASKMSKLAATEVVDVENTGEDTEDIHIVLREESEEPRINLADIPSIQDEQPQVEENRESPQEPSLHRHRNPRSNRMTDVESTGEEHLEAANENDGDDGEYQMGGNDEEESNGNEKKPHSLTSYDGFAIYSRILCLYVKRTEAARTGGTKISPPADSIMEQWIEQSQIAQPDQELAD